MYTIYVDASDRKNNSVKLLRNEESVEQILDEISGKIDIVQSIEKIIKRNSLTIQDISNFKSFPGPGSFTGLKKSFAITNILNWALGIKKDPTNYDIPNYGKEPNIG